VKKASAVTRWALLAMANWQDWSRFGDVDTSVAGAQSTTVNANYKDTYQLAIGAQYKVTPQWLWNAGIAYDTSAVSDSNRTVNAPLGESWRLVTVATYALDKDTEVNASWAMVWFGNVREVHAF
jgi:long-chain fatty acid transport protein